MNKKVTKVTTVNGTILYAKESLNMFSSFMNTANKGGTSYLEVFKDEALTVPTYLVLLNTETFEEHIVPDTGV